MHFLSIIGDGLLPWRQQQSSLQRLYSQPFSVTIHSCSQQQPPSDLFQQQTFVGSTPCDHAVKKQLGIPEETKCDFIKWELALGKDRAGATRFLIIAHYGEAQPNTNGFKGGGKSIRAEGEYFFVDETVQYSTKKVYRLQTHTFSSPLLLIEMDENIFHFLDPEKRFLVGNGGWSYVLNRSESY